MKIVKRIASIIPIIIFLIAIYIIISVSISLRNRKVPHVFGYSYMTVLTQSMEPTIKQLDFIVVNNTKDVKVGDIISFYYDVDNDGLIDVNTHEIINIDGDVITTHGVNNSDDVNEIISFDDVVGKVIYTSTFLGQIFSLNFIKNKDVVFLTMILFLVFFIIFQVVSIFKTIKSRKSDI